MTACKNYWIVGRLFGARTSVARTSVDLMPIGIAAQVALRV